MTPNPKPRPYKLPSRRRILILGAVGLVGGVMAVWERSGGVELTLTPAQAHAKAVAGEIVLIDIRRPDEWARTGSGQGAYRLDMRRKDFAEQVLRLVKGDRTHKIALICAAGVRSRRLSRRMIAAGFTRIIDIPEGMTGSSAGPGWVSRKLPLVF